MLTPPHRPVPPTARVALAAGLVIALGGCDRGGSSEHRVPKGVEPIATAPPRPATPQAQAPASQPAAAAAAAPEPWTAPAAWRRAPAASGMRAATYTIDDPDGPLEVAITRFPGTVGGMPANINRWRGQVGLPPVEPAEVDAAVQRFTHPGYDGYLLRLRGPKDHMLAAGIYDQARDQTWFVKVTASPAAADRVEAQVFDFARSFGAPRAGSP